VCASGADRLLLFFAMGQFAGAKLLKMMPERNAYKGYLLMTSQISDTVALTVPGKTRFRHSNARR
jgi:hypothetical protein